MSEVLEVCTALRRFDESVGRAIDGFRDARRALARAVGLSLAGVRATVQIDGSGLASAIDVVADAVERSLPLVVRVRSDDGHEPLHAAADRGAVVLFARDLQEAVDLTLVARRAAERALVPVLVACDLHERIVQDVELPAEPVVRRSIGHASEEIGTPTAEQRMLFGERRRRAPRWFDLTRPVLSGASTEGHVRAVARASRLPYSEKSVESALEESFSEVSRATGRTVAPLHAHDLDGARVVCIAQGQPATVGQVVTSFLRTREKARIGSIALCMLRPFPAATLLDLVRGRQDLVLLERAEGALADDPPLARELGAAMRRALENGRVGRRAHRDLGIWREKDAPTLRVGVVGPGSRSACSADVAAFCREVVAGSGRTQVRLGVDYVPARSSFPKRQALLDRLRRDHPGIEALGIHAAERGDVRPQGSLTADVMQEDLPAAARLLRAMVGGNVRSSIEGGRARLSVGSSVLTPGCDAPVDVVVSPCRGVHTVTDQLARGAVVVLTCREGESLSVSTKQLRERFVAVHRAPADWPDARLGALVAALRSRHPELETRRALAEFERLSGGDPKRVAAYQAAVERTRAVAGEDEPCCRGSMAVSKRPTPRLLLPLSRPSDTQDSLARFQDHVGVLHQSARVAELSPDPYLVAGTIPPLSAAFARGEEHRTLPKLDAAACTGCGACWTACPDGAIGPLALAPRALVEAAIDRAGRSGTNADALRMMVGKLASKLRPAATAGDALRAAYARLVEKAPPPADRREAIDAACAAAADAVQSLPLAGQVDWLGSGGEVLGLALDPDACKACGLCIAVCEPDAWTSAERTLDRVEAARASWQAWEDLPDTPGAVISRAVEAPDPGFAAALSLSRHALLPMAAGDQAEPGSGPRLATRLVLGTVEARLQPRLRARIEAIDGVRGELANVIRETLQQGLPTADLDALADGLDALGHRDLQLADLAARVGDVVEGGVVDGARLDRLVQTARDLADLRFLLETGPQGLGRSRAGLAIAPCPETAWARTFPWNPFAIPAAVGSDPGAFAEGLVEGQIDSWLDEVRLLRLARIVLDRPAEAEVAATRLRALQWKDVVDDERGYCPPLVLLGGVSTLAGPSLDRVLRLLRSDLPVVVVALADGSEQAPAEIGLLALAARDAFVAQSTVAHPDHLVGAVHKALAAGRPALLHVLAPSPSRNSLASDATLTRAAELVASRAFPLFVYDPTAEGVFGMRLDLAGNPADDAAVPDPDALPVWQTLRELAGVETPFTERVRAEIEKEVAARHGEEVSTVRADVERSAADSRAQIERELAERLRGRLTALAVRGMR